MKNLPLRERKESKSDKNRPPTRDVDSASDIIISYHLYTHTRTDLNNIIISVRRT